VVKLMKANQERCDAMNRRQWKFLAVLWILSASVLAQASSGYAGVWSRGITAGEQDLVWVEGGELRWLRAKAGPDETATMPFTYARAIWDCGGGRFLVSGRDAGGLEHVACVELSVVNEVPSIVLASDHTLLPGVEADAIAYSPMEGGIVVLEDEGKKFHFIPWVPGTAINQLSMFVGQSNVPQDPPSAWRVAGPGEVAGAVYCEGAATRIAQRNVMRPGIPATTTYRPYSILGVWSIEVIQTPAIPPSGPFASAGWHVKDLGVQGDIGTIAIKAYGGGTFDLVRVSDRSVALSGVVSANGGFEVFSLPAQGLVVGEVYRVEGGGQSASEFRPSYRRGMTVSADCLTMDRGGLSYESMVVGNSGFAAEGAIRWIGPTSPNPATAIPYYLWVAVGAPGPDTISDLGGGVMLLKPTATFVGRNWAGILEVPGYRLVRQTLPLTAEFAGQTLLFQWLGIGPQGNVFASDVFGYVVPDDPPVQSMQVTSGSQGGGVQQRETAEVRRARLCATLRARGNETAWALRELFAGRLLSQR
jgi:hypothetical protein